MKGHSYPRKLCGRNLKRLAFVAPFHDVQKIDTWEIASRRLSGSAAVRHQPIAGLKEQREANHEASF